MAKGPFSSKVRLTFLRGMEALGTTASNLASNAKLKAAEINLENRRREILTNFSLRAFEMWQKGEKLPGALSEMLSELSDIEDKLSVLRAQKYAKVPQPEGAPKATASPMGTEDDTADAAEAADQPSDTAEGGDGIPVSCTVSDEGGENGEPVQCELDESEPMDGPSGRYAPVEPEGENAGEESETEPEPEADHATDEPAGEAVPDAETDDTKQ